MLQDELSDHEMFGERKREPIKLPPSPILAAKRITNIQAKPRYWKKNFSTTLYQKQEIYNHENRLMKKEKQKEQR